MTLFQHKKRMARAIMFGSGPKCKWPAVRSDLLNESINALAANFDRQIEYVTAKRRKR